MRMVAFCRQQVKDNRIIIMRIVVLELTGTTTATAKQKRKERLVDEND